jgi:hypothetical protein
MIDTYTSSKCLVIGTGRIVSIRSLRVDQHIVWSLEFGDFAKDFITYDLDDY